MTLINRPNALPSVALVMYRYLSHIAIPVTEQHLTRALSPSSLSADGTPEDDEDDSGDGRVRAVDETLKLLTALGVTTTTKSGVSLAKDVHTADQSETDIATLRNVLRSKILSRTENGGEKTDLWDSDKGTRDFTRAAAWFLMQDVWSPPGRFTADAHERSAFHEQARQLPGVVAGGKGKDGKSVPLFNTGTRWNAFQRWMVFLGLAATDAIPGASQTMLMPDPTVAVRDVVAGFARQQFPVRKFLSSLAIELPVIDGGAYHQVVASRMSTDSRPDSTDRLTTGLSHALLRLEGQGLLELQSRADSPDVVALAGPNGSTVRVVARVVTK